MMRIKGLNRKLRLSRWAIVSLAIVVALASAGVTYARWADKPPKTDKVVFDDSFTWTVSNDYGGEEIGGIYDPIDPGDDGLDPCQTQTMGVPLPAEGRYDKDVASTMAIWDQASPLEIDITVNNAYPCYHSTVFFGMTGCEKVTAQIMAIIVDEDTTTLKVYPEEDAPELTVDVTGIAKGDMIDPGTEVIGAVAVHVEQDALENHTYTISVTIGVDCAEVECETAYAYGGDDATCFEFYNSKFPWGWTNGPLEPGDYRFEIHAGVGQCIPSEATLVGTLDVKYDGSTVTVTYNLDEGTLEATHLYVGTEPLPKNKQGKDTVSPGQYPYESKDTYSIDGFHEESIYIIAHAVVCGLE